MFLKVVLDSEISDEVHSGYTLKLWEPSCQHVQQHMTPAVAWISPSVILSVWVLRLDGRTCVGRIELYLL